jgi:hypothetical protein
VLRALQIIRRERRRALFELRQHGDRALQVEERGL